MATDIPADVDWQGPILLKKPTVDLDLLPRTGIHPMTGIMRPRLAQSGVADIGEALPCGRPCANACDTDTFRPWNLDFSSVKT